MPTESIAGPAPAAIPDDLTSRRRRNHLLEGVSRFGLAIFLVLLILAFGIWQTDRFFTASNSVSILTGQAVPIILAIAVLFPLVAGEFDLSVAANLSFSAVWVAYSSALGWPLLLVLATALAIGAFIGAVNSFFIVKIGVNAFIVTLSMATVLAGLNLLVTKGEVLFRGVPASLRSLGTETFIGFPLVVWVAVLLSFLVWYILEFTPYGRYIRATGSGREAARLSGVRTRYTLTSAFVISGTVAALAGFLQIARIGSANPNTGPEFLLPAYAAAFLGATVIQQGLFNLWGTIIGALVLAVAISGLTLAGAPFWLPNIFNGVALLIAVSLSALSGKRRNDAA
ncbi:ABC transporter permease [Streptomyces sp. NPDC005820]|uniref:ABC transporter permease n=1 Tax=Streptomyces sp. NPDC005820 TaxID=3157069 RepID=UPI0034112C14